MKQRYAAVLMLVVMCSVLRAGAAEYGELEMSSAGPSYTVAYSFYTDCPFDSLLEAFLHPRHVEACMKRGILRIQVLDSSAWRNRIAYTYNYLISRINITFDRRADSARGMVQFVMEACSISGSTVIPSVLSASGYYALVPEGGLIRVDYRQYTTMDRNLNGLYLFLIRRDTRRVLHTQQRYVNERHRWVPASP